MNINLKHPLKILFIPARYPEKYHPANGIFIREHARAVSCYNEVVVLYTENRPRETDSGGYRYSSELLEEGIRTIRYHSSIGHSPLSLWRRCILLYRGISFLFRTGWFPDIIHAHIYGAAFPAVLMKKIFNIPLVISEHSSGFIQKNLRPVEVLKARLAFNHADIVLPVSKHLLEAIKEYRMGRNFQILPNTVNTELFYPEDRDVKSEIKKILLVGLLKPFKGIDHLLFALGMTAEKRSDFFLDIVGDGPLRRELEKITEKLGLVKSVHFHGLQTKEEVARLMRSCSFLVQPSQVETFGITSIEAMACGKPVIATDLPVFREKITPDRGLLVPEENVAALATAINTMLEQYHSYAIDEIAKYARLNYGHQAIGGKLNEIYRHVLQSVKK